MSRLKKNNWFSFIFSNFRYQFPGMVYSTLTIGFFMALLVYLHIEFDILNLNLPQSFHTVLGLVTGLLLVFRTNTAYDRWWEGRKQLGTLLNNSRNMAFKSASFTEANDPERRLLRMLIPAFAWSLKEHLRNSDFTAAADHLPAELLDKFLAAEHKPNFILNSITKTMAGLYRRGVISGEQLIVMATESDVFANVLGSCERIRNTPIPMGYSLHLKRILMMYIITLPVGFINDLVWWSIPVVMIVFYTMVGIELIGEEIEEPFGTDPNDLPFDSIENKIRANVNEVFEQ